MKRGSDPDYHWQFHDLNSIHRLQPVFLSLLEQVFNLEEQLI